MNPRRRRHQRIRRRNRPPPLMHAFYLVMPGSMIIDHLDAVGGIIRYHGDPPVYVSSRRQQKRAHANMYSFRNDPETSN